MAELTPQDMAAKLLATGFERSGLVSSTSQSLRSKSFTLAGAPSPEVTVPFCLVPSPEFSQAPWYSLPDHLCRFGVRFLVT